MFEGLREILARASDLRARGEIAVLPMGAIIPAFSDKVALAEQTLS
jgi:hypothetical protein